MYLSVNSSCEACSSFEEPSSFMKNSPSKLSLLLHFIFQILSIISLLRQIFYTQMGRKYIHLRFFYTLTGIRRALRYLCPTRTGIRQRLRYFCYTLLPLISLFGGLCSCQHKDLLFDEIPDVRIEVRFDWLHDPEANPEGMRLFFYPINDTSASEASNGYAVKNAGYHLIDIPGKDGGAVYLHAGAYRIIAYNNDSEAVVFNNSEDLYTHHATTGSCGITDFLNGRQLSPTHSDAPSSSAHSYLLNNADYQRNVCNPYPSYKEADGRTGENEICMQPMNELWATVSDVVHVSHSTRSDSTMVITLYPKPVHCLYSCEIRNVNNIRYVSQVSGAISGLASTFHLEKNELGEECYTIPFAAAANLKENTITGRFLTFGHHSSNRLSHRLSLFVRMTDGSNYRFGSSSDRFDVTAQIDTASNPRRVHIVVDGLDIPLSFNDGFNPTPDDWQDVNTDVPI